MKKAEVVLISINGETFEAKRCCRCKVIKPLNDFYKSKAGVGGRRADCKVCYKEHFRKGEQLQKVRERTRNYYRKNRQHIIERKKSGNIPQSPYKWSKEKVIEEIKHLYTNEGSLKSTYVMDLNNPLLSAAERYFGSWENAVTEAGFNYDNHKEDRLAMVEYGYEFERIVAEILTEIESNIKPYKSNDSYRPDFQSKTFPGHWVDAKLTSYSRSTHRTIKNYKDECDVLTIVYFRGTRKPSYENIRFMNVFTLIDKYLHDEDKKHEFTRKLRDLESKVGNL